MMGVAAVGGAAGVASAAGGEDIEEPEVLGSSFLGDMGDEGGCILDLLLGLWTFPPLLEAAEGEGRITTSSSEPPPLLWAFLEGEGLLFPGEGFSIFTTGTGGGAFSPCPSPVGGDSRPAMLKSFLGLLDSEDASPPPPSLSFSGSPAASASFSQTTLFSSSAGLGDDGLPSEVSPAFSPAC